MGRAEGLRYLYLFLSPLLAGVKAHGDCCGSCEAEGIGLCGHCGLCECEAPPPLIRLAEDLHRRSEFCAILWANMMVICVSVGLSGDVAVTAKACQ